MHVQRSHSDVNKSLSTIMRNKIDCRESEERCWHGNGNRQKMKTNHTHLAVAAEVIPGWIRSRLRGMLSSLLSMRKYKLKLRIFEGPLSQTRGASSQSHRHYHRFRRTLLRPSSA